VRDLAHRRAQLGRVEDPKRAADLHQGAGHPLQVIGLRAQDHAAADGFERARVGRDAPLGFRKRQLQQHFDGPAVRDRRERVQQEGRTVEVERSGK